MKKLFVLIAIICGLVGCAIIKPLPASNTYQLSQLSDIHANKKSNKTLLVNRPIASTGYESKRMVYIESKKPYQLQTFAQNEWVAPPAQMLLPLLVQSLQNTNGFSAIVAPPFSGATDLRLDTRLFNLHQKFYSTGSEVEVALQTLLVNNRNEHVIAVKTFRITVTSQQSDPQSGVEAANRAVKNLLDEISKFVLLHAN